MFSGRSLPKADSTTLNAAAGEPETDEHAGREIEHQRRGGVGHHGEPDGVQDGADPQHADHAEPVRQHAGERLAKSPYDVLNRDREAEHVAAPVVGLRLRCQKEAERRARPEADHGDKRIRTARSRRACASRSPWRGR